MKRANFIGSLLVAFALGGTGMWSWQHYHRAPETRQMALNGLQPGAGGTAPPAQMMLDPVQQMAQMQQQMERFFNQDDFFRPGLFSGNFGSWFNTAHGAFGTKIQEGEDDKSVFYKLKVGDKDVSNVNVKVEDGYVSINAEITDKTRNSYAQSSISQSFPVPMGVDPDSAKIEQHGDEVVVRFEKVS